MLPRDRFRSRWSLLGGNFQGGTKVLRGLQRFDLPSNTLAPLVHSFGPKGWSRQCSFYHHAITNRAKIRLLSKCPTYKGEFSQADAPITSEMGEMKASLLNAALAIAVAIPPMALVRWLQTSKGEEKHLLLDTYLEQPLLFLNGLFAVFVCLTFWLISIAQKSTWLIDLYWTLIPALVGIYCRTHPRAVFDEMRSAISLGLLFLWATRLTHSYLRREKYCFGHREDWRFADMRRASHHFWWQSFFLAFLSQQPMLVGLCLPLFAIHFQEGQEPQPKRPWGESSLDWVAVVVCVVGLCVAYRADTDLQAFMEANEARFAAGVPKVKVLEEGLWRWSRHPNYVGEMTWWWGFGLFGAAVGPSQSWVLVGAAFNTCVMAKVTALTEARMTDTQPARREAYEDYQRRVAPWLPFVWLPAHRLRVGKRKGQWRHWWSRSHDGSRSSSSSRSRSRACGRWQLILGGLVRRDVPPSQPPSQPAGQPVSERVMIFMTLELVR